MDELKTRLKTIERLEPPDLWRRIETGEHRPTPATGPDRSKAVAVVVSFVVFAVAISGLWYAFSRPAEQPNVPMAPAAMALVRVTNASGRANATLKVGSDVQSGEVDRCPVDTSCVLVVPRITTPLIDMQAEATLQIEGWKFRRLGWCAIQTQYNGILCGGDFKTHSVRPVPQQLPMDPGTYVIQLEGVQNGVDLTVYFSIRIVSANRVESGSPEEIASERLLGPAACLKSATTKDPGEVFVDPDPVKGSAECAVAWRAGDLRGAAASDHQAPPLTECVRDRRIVIVPGQGASFCADNGLSDVPSDFAAVDHRWAKVIDVLRTIESSKDHCLDDPTFSSRVRRALDENGFSDWRLIDQFRESETARPCAAGSIDYGHLAIKVVNDTWS